MRKLFFIFLLTNIVFGQQINILSPQPHETIFKYHKKYPVTWEGPVLSYVKIQFSADGHVWSDISGEGEPNGNYFLWDVSLIDSLSGKLKIYEIADTSNKDISEYSFSFSDVVFSFISVNNAMMWISNSGIDSHDPRTDGSGFYWPKEQNISSIFQDALLIAGKINGVLHATGGYFRTGLMPGRVSDNSQPDEMLKYESKIFKINKNWETFNDEFIKLSFQNDYNDWPGEAGAPFNDINGDGIYTKGIDTPRFVGDEVLFHVMNDLDTVKCRDLFGSYPMGLEFQVTTFAFDRKDLLENVIFKKYKIINKSQNTIEDVIVSYWSDDDLGYASDDYVGCDTSLNLGYTWNSDNDDDNSYGANPPVVGHMYLQTPIVQSVGDTADFDFSKKQNYKNIPMSSFTPGMKNQFQYPVDPPLGKDEATAEIYNLMQGLRNDGDTLISPITNQPTLFPLNGDPVTKTGWYEGEGWPNGDSPHDKRIFINSGKFNMAPGDTQDVIIAIMMARGTDNVNSIAELRKTALATKQFFKSGFSPNFVVNSEKEHTPIPSEYVLYQNYPNPFNPSTTIKYSVPRNEKRETKNVKITVYDVLGNEVATLVDENQPAGIYEVKFDASSVSRRISSGVYFYQLKAGNFTETKKMLLMK